MIECNPDINFGMPALKGRRLTVFNIVTKVYYEESLERVFLDYEISLKDVKDALNYCSSLQCKNDKNRVHYCEGCVLRSIEEGFSFDKENYIEIDEGDIRVVKSKENKIYFLGSLQEFEDNEFGMVTWLIAEEISKKYL